MSEYYKQLSKEAKRRYDDTLLQLGVENLDKFDPFIDSDDWIDDITQWPDLQFGQIYVYLIDTPGPYTRGNLKCYKSLEAYNQYYSGWVQTCYFTKINDCCIIKGRVLRYQATTETPHGAWVALDDKDATIVCAHCTCMARLGEVCSHIAAILFKVEACARLGFNKVACTSVPCRWNQNHTKKVKPARLKEISFSKPKRRENEVQNPAAPNPNNQPVVFALSNNFLEKLKLCQPKAVTFSITDPKPQPLLSRPFLPPHLSRLYSIDNHLLSREHLTSKCLEVFTSLTCSQDQVDKVEVLTRRQSKCSLWFEYRKGRLTASNFHEICHTNSDGISNISLVKKILHYTPVTTSAAMKWGVSHESGAIQDYLNVRNKTHTNFVYRQSGLVISTEFPYLGASPDGFVSCDCCTNGLVEVKCPYSFSNIHPCEIKDSSFYLQSHSTHETCMTVLKHGQYYTQVQGQLALTKTSFCDFVCWTPLGIHIERIEADSNYFENMKIKLISYFQNIILPELLTQHIRTELESKDKNHSFCIWGRGEDYDDMIACDNEKCSKEWFHISCVGLKSIPQGKWVCLNCRHGGKGKRKRSQ